MKKFKFKLSPLKKIKEIEKLKIEQKLARVLEEIQKREREIEFNLQDIRNLITSASAKTSINLLFGENRIESRKNNIRILKDEIKKYELLKDEILKTLVKCEREIDKLDEIYENELKQFKKHLSKKEQEGIEENFMNTLDTENKF